MSAQVEALRPYQPQTPRWIEKTNRFIDQTVETAREVGHNLAQAGIYAATHPRETALKAAQNIYENRLEIGAGMASNRVITTAAHATLGTMDAIPGAGLAVKFTAITAAGTAKQALRFNRTITENGLKATFEDSKQKAVAIDSDNLVHDSIAWARTGIESNIAHLAFQTGRKEAAMRAIDASNVDTSITNMSPDDIVNIMYTFSQAHRFNKDEVTKQEANQNAMVFLTAAKQHLSPDEYQMVWNGYKQKLFGTHTKQQDGERVRTKHGTRTGFDANRAIYVGGIAFTRALRRAPTTLATSSLFGGAIHQIAEHTQLDEYASALGHKAIEAVKNAHIGEKFRDLAAHIQTPNFGQAMARAGRWFGDKISAPAAAATLTAQEREQLGYDQPPITNTGTLTNTHTLNTTTHISQPLPDAIDHQTNVDIHPSQTPTAPITPHLGPEIDQTIPELEISYTFEGHDYFSNAFFKTLMQLPAYQDIHSVEDMWTQPGTANDFLRLAKVGLIEAGYTDLSELPDSVDQDMTWAQLYHEFPHAFSSLNSFGVEGDDYADQFEITLAPEDVHLVGAPGVTEHLELHDVVNPTDHIDSSSPADNITDHASPTLDTVHTPNIDQPTLDPGHSIDTSQIETTAEPNTDTLTNPQPELAVTPVDDLEVISYTYQHGEHLSNIVFTQIAQHHPDFAGSGMTASDFFHQEGSAKLFADCAFKSLVKEHIMTAQEAETLKIYLASHEHASFYDMYQANPAAFAGMNNPESGTTFQLKFPHTTTESAIDNASEIQHDYSDVDNSTSTEPQSEAALSEQKRIEELRLELSNITESSVNESVSLNIEPDNTGKNAELTIQSTIANPYNNYALVNEVNVINYPSWLKIKGNTVDTFKDLKYAINQVIVYDGHLDNNSAIALTTCASDVINKDGNYGRINALFVPEGKTLSQMDDIVGMAAHSLNIGDKIGIGELTRRAMEDKFLGKGVEGIVRIVDDIPSQIAQHQDTEIIENVTLDGYHYFTLYRYLEDGQAVAMIDSANAPKITIGQGDKAITYVLAGGFRTQHTSISVNEIFDKLTADAESTAKIASATTTSVEPHPGT